MKQWALVIVVLCGLQATVTAVRVGLTPSDEGLFDVLDERAMPHLQEDESEWQRLIESTEQESSPRFREVVPTQDDDSHAKGEADDGDDDSLHEEDCARLAQEHAQQLSKSILACKMNHACMLALKKKDNEWIHQYNENCEPMQSYDTKRCQQLHTHLKDQARQHMAGCGGNPQCVVSALTTKANLDAYYQFQCGSLGEEAQEPADDKGTSAEVDALSKIQGQDADGDEDDDEPAPLPEVKAPSSTPQSSNSTQQQAKISSATQGNTPGDSKPMLVAAKILQPGESATGGSCGCCGQSECGCACAPQPVWVVPEVPQPETCACKPSCHPQCMCPNTCSCCHIGLVAPQHKEWVQPALEQKPCPCIHLAECACAQ